MKILTLSLRPCATTVAVTVAPDTRGVPTLSVAAVADSKHLVEHDFLADVRRNLFYFNFSPEATRYCLPPVFMTAYMVNSRYDSEISADGFPQKPEIIARFAVTHVPTGAVTADGRGAFL